MILLSLLILSNNLSLTHFDSLSLKGDLMKFNFCSRFQGNFSFSCFLFLFLFLLDFLPRRRSQDCRKIRDIPATEYTLSNTKFHDWILVCLSRRETPWDILSLIPTLRRYYVLCFSAHISYKEGRSLSLPFLTINQRHLRVMMSRREQGESLENHREEERSVRDEAVTALWCRNTLERMSS